MPLVSMTAMLERAASEGYAVGQFNLANLEFTQAILAAAEASSSPVILGVSEGSTRYMGGFGTIAPMVGGLMDEYAITVPAALHLDHGSAPEVCFRAMEAGFTSVMIDASHHPIEENIALTRQVVAAAHERGVSVEAEVGRIAGQEDELTVDEAEAIWARVEDCVQLVEETGVDILAPALGSVHGPYRGEPRLGFDRMDAIRRHTGRPLVLHGGSGIPDHQIRRAISLGTAKINVSTELKMAWTERVRETLDANPGYPDLRDYLGAARDAVEAAVRDKMTLFGSTGQAERPQGS